MGFFGPYEYVNKKGKKKYWLHVKDKGKVKLYYFSKDKVGALQNIPHGFEVTENEKTGLPFLRKITAAPKPDKSQKAEAS